MSVNSHGKKRTCPCKRLTFNLSSLTGAEYGDLQSLKRHNRDIVNKKDSAGNSPLHLAAQHGHVTATRYLLDMGCTVDNGGTGATPLHRASFAGAVTTMQLLLERMDKASLVLPDLSFGDRMTALHKAASGGRYLAVQLLLSVHKERGTLSEALDARDARNRTPLEVAQSNVDQQSEERKSVARWDVVAGGVADWMFCVQILHRAARDGTVMDLQQIHSLPPNPFRQINDECVDCEDGNECVTSSWERAFRNGLMLAMERQFSAPLVYPAQEQTDQDLTTSTDDAYTSARDELNGELELAHDSTRIVDANCSFHDVRKEESQFGRPCGKCLIRSLFLYSDKSSGMLVCKQCKQTKFK